MTTKNLIPRASGEGGIGITDVTWGYGYYDTGNFNKGLFVKGSGIEDVIANTVTQGGLGGEWTKAVNGLDIYYNGGNVGIGTSDPGDSLLNVSPTAGTDPSSFKVLQNSTAGPATGRNGGVVLIDANHYQDSSDIFSVNGRGVNKLTIKGGGNVGIGTTDPGVFKTVFNNSNDHTNVKIASGDNKVASLFFGEDAGLGATPAWLQRYGSAHATPGKVALGAVGTASWVAIQGDSADVLNIRGNGNVGIGTTDPLYALDVYGFEKGIGITSILTGVRITHAALQTSPTGFGSISAMTNVGNQSVWFNSDGNDSFIKHGRVGIGTTTPDATLHVISDTAANALSLTREIDVLTNFGAASKIRGGALATTTPTYGGAIGFASEAAGAGSTSGLLYFETKDPGGSLTEKMRIDSAGNVGIGTTIPGAALDVAAIEAPTIHLTEKTNNHFGRIGIPSQTGQVFASLATPGSLAIRNDIKIELGGQTPFVTIDGTNGEVGIGTTNPGAKLDVRGSFKLNNTGGGTLYPTSDDVYRNGATTPLKHSIILNTAGWRNASVIESITGTTPSGVSTEGLYLNSTYGSKLFASASVHVNCNTGNGDISFLTGTGAAAPTTKFRLQSNGNVGIGTTSPGTNKLYVNGNIFASGTITPTSDDRVKHNEQTIVGAIEILGKLTPKKYIKTTEMYDADHDFELDANGDPVDENGEPVAHAIEAGVIAQKVLEVPELAFTVSPEGVDEDGNVTSPHGLNYNSLFTYAIAAIQEQQQLIEDLKSRIETLENK